MAEDIKSLNKKIATFMLLSFAISASAVEQTVTREEKVMYAAPDIDIPVSVEVRPVHKYAPLEAPVIKIRKQKIREHVLMYGVPSIIREEKKEIIKPKPEPAEFRVMYAPPEYFIQKYIDKQSSNEIYKDNSDTNKG